MTTTNRMAAIPGRKTKESTKVERQELVIWLLAQEIDVLLSSKLFQNLSCVSLDRFRGRSKTMSMCDLLAQIP